MFNGIQGGGAGGQDPNRSGGAGDPNHNRIFASSEGFNRSGSGRSVRTAPPGANRGQHDQQQTGQQAPLRGRFVRPQPASPHTPTPHAAAVHDAYPHNYMARAVPADYFTGFYPEAQPATHVNSYGDTYPYLPVFPVYATVEQTQPGPLSSTGLSPLQPPQPYQSSSEYSTPVSFSGGGSGGSAPPSFSPLHQPPPNLEPLHRPNYASVSPPGSVESFQVGHTPYGTPNLPQYSTRSYEGSAPTPPAAYPAPPTGNS